MAAVIGRNFILAVDAGGASFNDLTGQRNGTFTRTTTTVDSTTKAEAGQSAFLASRLEWTFDADGIMDDTTDTAWGDLVDAYDALTVVSCRFTDEDSNTYIGNVLVTTLELTGPEDDVYSYTVSLQGTGTLTTA